MQITKYKFLDFNISFNGDKQIWLDIDFDWREHDHNPRFGFKFVLPFLDIDIDFYDSRHVDEKICSK